MYGFFVCGMVFSLFLNAEYDDLMSILFTRERIPISCSQINPGEVILEENFDNLDNWIIETGQNDERRLIDPELKKIDEKNFLA